MSLFAYNLTGAPLALAAGGVTLPASSNPPERGPAVNVLSELDGLSSAEYVSLQTQVAAGLVEFEWNGNAKYSTGALLSGLTLSGLDQIVYAPGHPKGNHDNVFVDWVLLYQTLKSTRDQGLRRLHFDARYSTLSVPGIGSRVILIPAGDASNGADLINGQYRWDMLNVIWTSAWARNSNVATHITFDDHAYIHNLANCVATSMNIWNKSTVHSPFNRAFIEFGFEGGENALRTTAGALPLFDQSGFTIAALQRWRVRPGAGAPVFKHSGFNLFIASGDSCRLDSNSVTGTGYTGYLCFEQGGYGRQTDFHAATSGSFEVWENGHAGPNWSANTKTARTSDVTAGLHSCIYVDTSGGPVTVTMPEIASVNYGPQVRIIDVGGAAASSSITVAPAAGETIQDGVIDINGQSKTWQAFGTAKKWVLVSKT